MGWRAEIVSDELVKIMGEGYNDNSGRKFGQGEAPYEGTKKEHWRLLDDDRNVYYTGWLQDEPIEDEEDEDGDWVEDAWTTLFDWGCWYAGCTMIEQWDEDRQEWIGVIS